MNLIADWAFTEFPASSRGGAKADTPMTPGNTAITPPPTPLFGRYAGGVHPVARMLVEAYGRNHRRDFRCQAGFEHRLFGDGVHTVIGDGSCGNAQLLGRDAERTLASIEVESHVRIIVDAVVVFQQPGNGAVVEVGSRFRFVQFVDELWGGAAQLSDILYNGIPFLVGVSHWLYHGTGGNGTGIYQWSGRVVVFPARWR